MLARTRLKSGEGSATGLWARAPTPLGSGCTRFADTMNMTTSSLDTNILVSLWDSSNSMNLPAMRCLNEAHKRGAIRICGPVYAELMANPARSLAEIDEFFTSTGIEVDWELDEKTWRIAGRAFRLYVHRRIASGRGLPRRIAADFAIGAHA